MSTIVTHNDVDSALASRLRAERELRDWTLAELSARSGVSRAMLSKIERGEASPTATLLGRLSAAFGLTVSQLFARAEGGGQLSRRDEQSTWRDPETGFVRRSLSPAGNTPLEMMWGEMPPGASISYTPASYRFIADQQLVVIEGRLAIRRPEQIYELNPGDCLRWGPPAETTFENPGRQICRYVVALLRAPG